MKLLLIRHGLTLLGEQGQYQGEEDSGLSRKGREMLLRSALMPDRLFCSPKRRAIETAEILFPESEIEVRDDLREMHFGLFEGRSWRDMADDPTYRAWVDGGCRGACPGGEDRESFSRRVCREMEGLLQEAETGGAALVAVVAHGGTQMAVLSEWGEPRRDYYAWQTACGCGYELDICPEPLKLKESGRLRFVKES